MNNMTYSLVWSALFSLISQASSQNVQIQAIPQTVTLRENDLVVLCSITNPSQLASLFFIQLSKNASGNFTTVVSVASGNKLLWADSTLYNRGAIASGSISTKSTPQLRFTILKDIVRCPDDFKLYKCKMSGFDLQSNAFESETMPITITYNIKPNVIEMPRVRILGETNDTPNRQFSIGTVIEITCEGQIGSDPSNTIGWCAKRASELSFITLANTPIHSDATPLGCQYTRSSTITYNLTNYDTFTRFLCESGDTGTCGTGTAIQYVNITIVRPTLIVKVRIMNDHNDTTKRQFPVGTVLQITCQGQIGSDPNKTIGWCIQKKNEPSFTRLSQTPLHSDAGNQSSTITYNLTSEDIFTRFLCESGDTGLCGTGTAIQYVNISTTGTEGSSTTSAPSTDDLPSSTNSTKTEAESNTGLIVLAVVGWVVVLIVIILVLVYICSLKENPPEETNNAIPDSVAPSSGESTNNQIHETSKQDVKDTEGYDNEALELPTGAQEGASESMSYNNGHSNGVAGENADTRL